MTEVISNKNITVDASNKEISPDLTGSQRSFISIVNTSIGTQVIYISIGQEAVIGQGVPLYQGGVYQESLDAGYKPTNKQINAISSLAGGSVAIQERIFVKVLIILSLWFMTLMETGLLNLPVRQPTGLSTVLGKALVILQKTGGI